MEARPGQGLTIEGIITEEGVKLTSFNELSNLPILPRQHGNLAFNFINNGQITLSYPMAAIKVSHSKTIHFQLVIPKPSEYEAISISKDGVEQYYQEKEDYLQKIADEFTIDRQGEQITVKTPAPITARLHRIIRTITANGKIKVIEFAENQEDLTFIASPKTKVEVSLTNGIETLFLTNN